MAPKKNEHEYNVGWVTVSYRTVLLLILLVVGLIGAGFYFHSNASRVLSGLTASISSRIGRIAGTDPNAGGGKIIGQQQAKFTQLDGTVRVKKASSNSWADAKYDTPLEKGDVIQTSSEGMAKVVFADGSNYTIKPDSLIVVEENSTNASQQTQVAVQVTTGTVDLATSTYTQGSKSQVIVAGATATLAPDTSALVLNDPRADTHEIFLKKGSGEVARGSEVVQLTNLERVSFKSSSPEMTKSKEIGPPTLIVPANMMTTFAANKQVEFTWTPVAGTRGYHIRISRNPYFSSLLVDKKVSSPEFTASGIGDGSYYWSVQSIDANGRESIESERNRFNVLPKTAEASVALTLEPLIRHGHVIEVSGKTEANTRVMVNGEEVPVVGGDGTFHYYTPPLPNGENVITITAQSNRGGINTKTAKVTIQ